MDFHIRRAAYADAQGIIDSHVRSIREVCSQDYTPEQIEAWGGRNFRTDRWCETMDRDRVWVVEVGGLVRGFGHLALLPDGAAEVMGLYFAPEARGIGAGKRLFKLMREVAVQNGVKRLRLQSTLTAKSFYESVGFRVVEGPSFVEMRGVKIRCFPMELSLE